ncbi:MAG: hypothetical protein A2X94_11850 [Bdellovibrionales bacterium GWB1_55_8]|nr:MAG: hypothetical protein A2X94_11850 [Bdellovibrionales bacterium GWB1_55_8]
MKRSVIAAFAVLALSSTAFANQPMKSGDEAGKMGSEKGMMTPDKLKQSAVLNEIHHLNQKEIEMARLVQTKAQSPELKEYARTIVTDHEKADKRVMDLAKSQNLELSKYSAAGYEKEMKKNLEKLSGTEFDRAFVEMARMDHKSHLQEYKMTETSLQDPQIQQFVRSDFIPVLERHQTAVDKIPVTGTTTERAGEMGEEDMSSGEYGGDMGGEMGTEPTTTGEQPSVDSPSSTESK